MECRSGYDIGVRSVLRRGAARPGGKHELIVFAGDMNKWYEISCVTGLSGKIRISVSGPVAYQNSLSWSIAPDSVSGNDLIYDISNFAAMNQSKLGLEFKTDTSASAGDSICVNIEVSPDSADFYPANNTYDFCYRVVNSYDPNEKEVYPFDVPPGFADWLTYTIYFQNTGNAPAIDVVLRDTLDSKLVPETFQVMDYSHPVQTSLKGRALSFSFKDINLPDSNSNEKESHGFVQYRIKPMSNLPAGTKIENTAYIYFDYNPAVVTNTTVNEYVDPVNSVRQVVRSGSVNVYPNPGNGSFTVKMDNDGQYAIEVYSVIGVCVYRGEQAGSEFQLDLRNKPNGLYLLKVKTRGGEYIAKLIKQ
jgi:uncharacterized repeat protein (TIGR01451 family)